MAITVTGPDRDDHPTSPSITAGVSAAQYRAAMHTEPGAWYVREDGATRYVVERREDRVILTTARSDA